MVECHGGMVEWIDNDRKTKWMGRDRQIERQNEKTIARTIDRMTDSQNFKQIE